jgi:hypothetical protein
MKTLDEFLDELEAYDPNKLDCRACEIEANDELVKQKPRHTCGKDGPAPDVKNELKKPKE